MSRLRAQSDEVPEHVWILEGERGKNGQGILGPKLLLVMGCVKLDEKIPSAAFCGEQNAN